MKRSWLPRAITIDAVRRAFEAVGVVFLPMTTFNYEATCRRRDDHKRRGSSGSSRPTEQCTTRSPRVGRPRPSTQCVYGNGIISCSWVGGPVQWGFGKGRVSPALFFSDGAIAGAAELDAIRRLG
jgi:hypothetical protein